MDEWDFIEMFWIFQKLLLHDVSYDVYMTLLKGLMEQNFSRVGRRFVCFSTRWFEQEEDSCFISFG